VDGGGILSGQEALAAYVAAALAVYLAARYLARPLLWLLRAAWRIAWGGALVWVVDAVGRSAGLHIALNPVTAGVVGFLGVPGLAVLLLQRGI
jgi:inhibitor of the pro-sigma K processing machinery